MQATLRRGRMCEPRPCGAPRLRRGLIASQTLALALACGMALAGPAAASTNPPSASPAGSLVVNGSFTAGATGFRSAYTPSTSLGLPQTYAIGNDPALLNGAWPAITDPSSTPGPMMIVNGATTADATIWSESVEVSGATTYTFSAWVASLYTSPAVIQFTVNGRSLGSLPAPSAVGKWSAISERWQSGASGRMTLGLIDDNLAYGGNDFALDDIAFTAAGAVETRVSTLASTITTPQDAFSSGSRTVRNAVVAAIVVLFIAFPSQLFNHTLDENREAIGAWWEGRFSLLRRARRRLEHRDRRWIQALVAVAVVLIGGLLDGLLDPHFGLTRSSVLTYAGIVSSIAAGVTVSGVAIHAYRTHRNHPSDFQLHALPAGLGIAALCVLVSRLADFEPGYLYGIICGVSFRQKLDKRAEGHAIALGVIATLTLALAAWLAWIPLHHLAAHPHEAWPVIYADDLAGTIFVGSIVSSVISCFPLRFLPGGTVAAWHRGAWAALFGAVIFIFLEVILEPGRGGHSGHGSLATVITLFAIFGVGSVAFYLHFALKKTQGDPPAGDDGEADRPSSPAETPGSLVHTQDNNDDLPAGVTDEPGVGR